jgi:hypothetical protein
MILRFWKQCHWRWIDWQSIWENPLRTEVFRSIDGGSFQSFLDANDVDLEEVSDDVILESSLISLSPTWKVLVPLSVGTLLPVVAAKAPSVAAQEYRKIFEGFWYIAQYRGDVWYVLYRFCFQG